MQDPLAQGRYFAQYDRDADALPYLEQAVQQYPTSLEAWVLLSNARSVLRNFFKADAAANQALSLGSQSLEALCAKARALGGLRQFQPAFGMVDRALQINPRSELSLVVKSNIFAEAWKLNKDKRQLSQGIQLCDSALQFAPNYIYALTSKSRLLAYAGRTKDALAVARAAFEMHPNSLLTQATLSLCFTVAHNFSEAMRIAEGMIAQSPGDFRGWVTRGAIFSEMGQRGRSRSDWMHAAELNPENPELLEEARAI